MNKISIEKVAMDATAERWLRWLDAEVFPEDILFSFSLATWWLAWDGPKAVAYCGWKPVMMGAKLVGFHYRAGVLPAYRGKHLQKKMIKSREQDMKRQGIKEAVSYTDSNNAPSMRSLIGAGYRPYEPTQVTQLAGLARTGFVHWRKDL